jgi:hypothetical protein
VKIESPAFANGEPIPPRLAFGRMDRDQHVALSDNRNPALRWSGLPEATKSLALLCFDPDVPSEGTDVNQEGRSVPADLPRVDFFHWVLVDISPQLDSIAEGAASDSVTPRGKAPGRCEFGVRGINDYTGWFAQDPDMSGDYGGYDGPCPPWNDSIVHHYHFCVYALDVASLGLQGGFGGAEVRRAMDGHVLAEAQWVGTYTLNPDL